MLVLVLLHLNRHSVNQVLQLGVVGVHLLVDNQNIDLLVDFDVELLDLQHDGSSINLATVAGISHTVTDFLESVLEGLNALLVVIFNLWLQSGKGLIMVTNEGLGLVLTGKHVLGLLLEGFDTFNGTLWWGLHGKNVVEFVHVEFTTLNNWGWLALESLQALLELLNVVLY